MEIRLYTVSKKLHDLTPAPSGAGVVVNVQVRGDVSLTKPTFQFTNEVDTIAHNYIYVPSWNRYYFIDSKVFSGNTTILYTTEDYLTSWSDTIRNQQLYCVRSSNRVNGNLTDTKFPSTVQVNYVEQFLNTPWLSIANGRYVIAISSGGNDHPHIGTNCYYVLTSSQMTQFMEDLMGSFDFSIGGIADGIVKTMINPLQYIQSCIWLPCDLDANTTDVSSIDFGWWSSSTSAKVLDIQTNDDCVTEYHVSVTPNDNMRTGVREYLKYQPYSNLILTAYPFGAINLNTEIVTKFMNGDELTLRVVIDHLSGMGTLIITSPGDAVPLYITTSQIGVDIPVGQVLQDFAGSALSAAGAAASLASGSVLGAAAGIKSSIEGVAPDSNVMGTAGGFAQLMLNDSWCITRKYRNITEIDTDLLGEPCCETRLVDAFKGYAQFENPDITGTMLSSEKEAINSMLREGIFIA